MEKRIVSMIELNGSLFIATENTVYIKTGDDLVPFFTQEDMRRCDEEYKERQTHDE